ncbi:DUF1036 domain-containing protein (plasmid) [Adhaeribacter swui]|uniref:DUF1036 domain-containing protein n=1 Tax=Adhaeribacter swui TaxID=2086471 RepID=A0A7G7G2K1_9BACT|nr:DUF1036 domain-containing protein [Adhaeribacter swui]QNF31385.1 DUF1036 domain-containing protein [Adhaeribacter swui]
MNKLLLALLVSLSFLPCMAQLKVVNPSDYPISLAVGYYADKGLIKGWSTLGWVNIAAHDSTNLLPRGVAGDSFYYYGRVSGCDQVYEGQYGLFIHPTDAFQVSNAASEAPISLTKGVAKVPFVKVDLPANSRNYRLVLPKVNCTQTGKRQGNWTIYLDRDKEETSTPEDASYIRNVKYQNGEPTGIVRDYYYPSKKLQWDGKLLGNNLEIKHGTCFTYDENGKKREEATYQNGQLVGEIRRWNEMGKEVVVRKSYKAVKVLDPQKGYLVSYYNPGKSRTVIPVKLPANTVAWYYEFTASRNQAEVAASQAKFQLLSQLTTLVDETGITKLAVASLSTPPGGSICNVYLMKEVKQADSFEAKKEFYYDREGSRTSLSSAVVPIKSNEAKYVSLGLQNPDNLYGVHYALEVIAIVEESK